MSTRGKNVTAAVPGKSAFAAGSSRKTSADCDLERRLPIVALSQSTQPARDGRDGRDLYVSSLLPGIGSSSYFNQLDVLPERARYEKHDLHCFSSPAFCPSLAFGGIVAGPFGPFGEGGFVNGQAFTFGSGGNVYELDSFVNIAGFDLNGGTLGTSGQLSVDSLPAGLVFGFDSSVSADMTDITLTYSFRNLTGGALNGFQFFPFVDADIDDLLNTYFNEAGSMAGAVGSGASDSDPDSWEIDEPGYVFGDIFDNLLLGSLDNTNNVPIGFPDDVSMALGFDLGTLGFGQLATISILLSQDGDSVGSLSLTQFDTDPLSTDTLTLSGGANVSSVPEPSSCLVWLVTGVACLAVRRRRKAAAKTEA